MTSSPATAPAAPEAEPAPASYYKHHIFFCLNERANGENACGHYGAQQAFERCKAQVKAAGLAEVAQHECDALLVLLADGFKPGKDKLSHCIAGITKAGDLPAKPGKTLSLYRPQGLVARRVVLAAVGDGSAQHVRSAVVAALGGLKSGSPKQLVVAFVLPPSASALRAVEDSSKTAPARDASFARSPWFPASVPLSSIAAIASPISVSRTPARFTSER